MSTPRERAIEIMRINYQVADVIRPDDLEYSAAAARLMGMCWAHESAAGKYHRQKLRGGGEYSKNLGAWGVFQMEVSATERVSQYLDRRPSVSARVDEYLRNTPDGLIGVIDWGAGTGARVEDADPYLLLRLFAISKSIAAVYARIYWLFDPNPIPVDPGQMAIRAKAHWNTDAGKATPGDYLEAYNEHIAPLDPKLWRQPFVCEHKTEG